MNLQDQIMEELSTQMQSEMDFEILSDMLVELGWTRVIISRFQNNHRAVDIKYWLEENARGFWESRGSTFVFENKGDAVNFTLRWK